MRLFDIDVAGPRRYYLVYPPRTAESPKRDRDELSTIFVELCNGVGADLARKGYAGRTIGVKLRYDNFATVTRDRTEPLATDDAGVIRRVAADCVRRAPLARDLRLLGVRVSGLVRAGETRIAREPEAVSASLFD
jgi:DNA polymerase-4